VTEAFFHPLPAPTGEPVQRLIADEACTGPWSAETMHGGPPSALLVRACERSVAAANGGGALTALRACIDFLAPVPIGEVTVRSRVLRGGRRVSLAEAVLEAGGQEVMQARTWLLRSAVEAPLDDDPDDPATAAVSPAARPTATRPGPHACPPALTDWAFPYARALEWRHVSGDPGGPGDAAAWARPRIPLVAGEQPSGLQRAVLVADSGNGISAALDWGRWTFVNVDLVVHLSRPLDGEWVLLDARTRYEPGGTGLSTSVLHDRAGTVGTGAQTLLVSPR
jgi:acyl-coenzyme A thioesterase PaaI-like protein